MRLMRTKQEDLEYKIAGLGLMSEYINSNARIEITVKDEFEKALVVHIIQNDISLDVESMLLGKIVEAYNEVKEYAKEQLNKFNMTQETLQKANELQELIEMLDNIISNLNRYPSARISAYCYKDATPIAIPIAINQVVKDALESELARLKKELEEL